MTGKMFLVTFTYKSGFINEQFEREDSLAEIEKRFSGDEIEIKELNQLIKTAINIKIHIAAVNLLDHLFSAPALVPAAYIFHHKQGEIQKDARAKL